MANRNFPSSKLFSMHVQPVALDVNIAIGASGAVSSFSGLGVQAVSKLGTGLYLIQLQDPYNSVIQMHAQMTSPPTGSAVTAGSFVTGTLYVITSLGSTNFNAIGVPANAVPAIGMPFVATGAGSGTGTATAVGVSLVPNVEMVNYAQSIQALNNGPGTVGGYFIIQTLSVANALISPASGSVIEIQIQLNNSAVQ